MKKICGTCRWRFCNNEPCDFTAHDCDGRMMCCFIYDNGDEGEKYAVIVEFHDTCDNWEEKKVIL